MANDKSRTKRQGTSMQRASEAWHLRVMGKTWQQIADEVGYANPSNAHRAVSRFAGTIPDPKPDALRDLWRARIEHLWVKAVRDVEAARPGALRAGVAIAQRAAAMDGLDAPQRFALTPDELELQRIVEVLATRAGLAGEQEADVLELEALTGDDERL